MCEDFSPQNFPAIQPKRNQDLFQQNRNLQNNQHPNYNQKGLTLTQQQQQNFINNSQNQFDVNNSQSSIIGIKPEMMIMINDVNQSGFNEKNTYNINKSGQQVQNWQQRGRNSQNQRISSRFASQQNREIQQVIQIHQSKNFSRSSVNNFICYGVSSKSQNPTEGSNIRTVLRAKFDNWRSQFSQQQLGSTVTKFFFSLNEV